MSGFDPAKDAINIAKHGISLTRANDINVVKIVIDGRIDYGEQRFRAYGYIDGLAYCLVFTVRANKRRPISLRRVHTKEMKHYVT